MLMHSKYQRAFNSKKKLREKLGKNKCQTGWRKLKIKPGICSWNPRLSALFIQTYGSEVCNFPSTNCLQHRLSLFFPRVKQQASRVLKLTEVSRVTDVLLASLLLFQKSAGRQSITQHKIFTLAISLKRDEISGATAVATIKVIWVGLKSFATLNLTSHPSAWTPLNIG